MFFIYRITHRTERKVYIGQTDNIGRRWGQYKTNVKYNNGDTRITRAMIENGICMFDFDIIVTCRTEEDANVLEKELINQYNSRFKKFGYNRNVGGGVTRGINREKSKEIDKPSGPRKLSEKTKRRMSEAAIGKPGTNTGKHFGDEWKLNLSKGIAGKEILSTRRFSKEQENKICRLYTEEEKSTYNLGNMFDCNRSLIKDILIRYDIKIRKSNYTGHSNGCNKFSLDQEKEICKIYQEGNITRTDLAKKFNCAKNTIRGILVRHGVIKQ